MLFGGTYGFKGGTKKYSNDVSLNELSQCCLAGGLGLISVVWKWGLVDLRLKLNITRMVSC